MSLVEGDAPRLRNESVAQKEERLALENTLRQLLGMAASPSSGSGINAVASITAVMALAQFTNVSPWVTIGIAAATTLWLGYETLKRSTLVQRIVATLLMLAAVGAQVSAQPGSRPGSYRADPPDLSPGQTANILLLAKTIAVMAVIGGIALLS